MCPLISPDFPDFPDFHRENYSGEEYGYVNELSYVSPDFPDFP